MLQIGRIESRQRRRNVRVEVRLFATFARFAPMKRAGEPFEVALPASTSIDDLLHHLGIPPAEVHLTMVDGRIVHDRCARLPDGARVGLFPPVGGG